MEAEAFEKRLRQQRWREVPPSWRSEILAAARASSSRSAAGGVKLKLWAFWNDWLFPSPRAWAVAVVIWLVVGVWNLWMDVSFSEHGKGPPVAVNHVESFRHQQRVMAELLDMDSMTEPPAPRRPSPRSERGASPVMG